MSLPPAPTITLDRPLPVELTGRGHGWFTRYRTWPVYSPGWVRGRLLSVGSVAALMLAVTLLGMLLAAPADRPLGGVAQLALNMLWPIVAGPWAASLVRRRSWPPVREWRALVAVMLAVVAVQLAFNQWGAEPLKQSIAEAAGQVDASGKRKRVVLAVGVSITSPDQATGAAPSGTPASGAPDGRAAPPAADPRDQDPILRATNLASAAGLTFLLAGGAGLWGWRRERDGLAALARERELARAQAERREAELRLSVLAAQVEPHFLFNTLAGVRSAIATDPARASEMIDRLVDYLRASIPRLRSDGVEQATLGAQLDIVRAYLGLMAARMPRLAFEVDAPAELLAAPCPPLMLISLAENAVKHGIEPRIGPARIEVTARRAEDGRLEITVADDGAGFGASAAGGGLGLANIRERLQQMYQGRAALTLKARPEGGVAATIVLPTE
jgi:signal transduction histidine kinase